MLRLLLVLLLLFLIVLAFSAPQPANFGALTESLAALWDAGLAGLCEIAELDHALQAEIWTWFPDRLRAVLGGLKCLNAVLVLVGISALRGLHSVWRRYL